MFSLGRIAPLALTLLFPFTSNAQLLCFASASTRNPIRLQLTLPSEGSQAAFVRYEKGRADIPLLRTSEVVVPVAGQGPATVRSTFSELLDGKRTGQYVLTTQGGAVGDLVYKREKGKKQITFFEDQGAATSAGCDWPN